MMIDGENAKAFAIYRLRSSGLVAMLAISQDNDRVVFDGHVVGIPGVGPAELTMAVGSGNFRDVIQSYEENNDTSLVVDGETLEELLSVVEQALVGEGEDPGSVFTSTLRIGKETIDVILLDEPMTILVGGALISIGAGMLYCAFTRRQVHREFATAQAVAHTESRHAKIKVEGGFDFGFDILHHRIGFRCEARVEGEPVFEPPGAVE
ncbi:hypothetical protein ACQCSX_22495 (plasmid) [Pseudarthrobacter sp. P1]|uniref:hypothetical protein n=1 Tax=Pseudarthrobacter sp. P1 TaxID=3418418 RepID=UPI003CF3A9A5